MKNGMYDRSLGPAVGKRSQNRPAARMQLRWQRL